MCRYGLVASICRNRTRFSWQTVFMFHVQIAQPAGSQTNGVVLSPTQDGSTDCEDSHPDFTTSNSDHYQEDTMDMDEAGHGGNDIIPVHAENNILEMEDAEVGEQAIIPASTPSTGENRYACQAESADDNEMESHDGLDWKFVNGNVLIEGIKVSSASANDTIESASRKTKRDHGLIRKEATASRWEQS